MGLRRAALRLCALAGLLLPAPAFAQAQAGPVADAAAQAAPSPGAPAPEGKGDGEFAFHAQSTFVLQGHPGFPSAFRGTNSLSPDAQARETFDITLYIGARLWRGAEVWIDPEVDQGFGLNNTLGVAGFPSGEAYKVGEATPYFRVQKIFVRQTLDLGGEVQTVDPDQNQMSGTQTANRLVVTAGKFSVGDVFDTNKYAHNPRGDFLNWTVIDAGTFDYAADAWGYTAGAAAEWYVGRWTLRGGGFLLSNVPNSTKIDTRFDQFQLIGEVERRHTLWGQPGRVLVTGYLSRGRMGRYDDAVALAEETGTLPDPARVRRYASRPGVSLDLEQQLTSDLGAFARAGWADGRFEAYEFTDVDRTVSGGLSLSGGRWKRAGDTVGLAGVVNVASTPLERFLGAGGLGILVGDGALPHPGTERILETYYDAALPYGLHLAADYQFVANPAYNTDRGPASIIALRVHDQF